MLQIHLLLSTVQLRISTKLIVQTGICPSSNDCQLPIFFQRNNTNYVIFWTKLVELTNIFSGSKICRYKLLQRVNYDFNCYGTMNIFFAYKQITLNSSMLSTFHRKSKRPLNVYLKQLNILLTPKAKRDTCLNIVTHVVFYWNKLQTSRRSYKMFHL